MFSEYRELNEIASHWPKFGEVRELARVDGFGHAFPILEFSIGSKNKNVPTLMFTGGVHGLERIGSWIAFSYMRHVLARLPWDAFLHDHLNDMRLVFVPLINPVGMMQFRRSNGRGVDLMRNAPIVSSTANFGVGGQSYSRKLPWYRGNIEQTHEGMEVEAKALVRSVQDAYQTSPVVLALDLHSGFGLKDQLWFPYAHSKQVFEDVHLVYKLKQLMDQVMPHHVYHFEPQSKNYTTHGDLWDYLHMDFKKRQLNGDQVFLPLTLEMGSWNWVKKNPLQLFSFLGPFNPIKPHRQKRAMRRHLPLFDFLMHLTANPRVWEGANSIENRHLAIERWYSINE